MSNNTKISNIILTTNINVQKETNDNQYDSNRSNSAMHSLIKKEQTTKDAFSKIVTQTINPKIEQRESKKPSTPQQKKLNPAHSVNLKYLLPNKTSDKKTLVLDLDETLIHSNFEDFQKGSDIKISVKIDNILYKIFAIKRPGVEEFLDRMSKFFEIVIYTASMQQVRLYFNILF